jgi:diguanylate cyclase (GGDEF)-like protein
MTVRLNPIRLRLLVAAVFAFTLLAFGATSILLSALRRNLELFHQMMGLSSVQMVKLYIELSLPGEWRARGGYLYKGEARLVDGVSIRSNLAAYMPPDMTIVFGTGDTPNATKGSIMLEKIDAILSRGGGAPPNAPWGSGRPPGPDAPGAMSGSPPPPQGPNIPYSTAKGACIVIRDAGGGQVGWISMVGGENLGSFRDNRLMLSVVFVSMGIFLAAIAAFGMLMMRLTRPIERIAEAHESAKERNRELASASRTDALTGLLNRRGLAEAFEDPSGPPFSHVAIIDVDHFKAVNDERGHEEGDRVLAAVAEAVGAAVRSGDLCGRWGGEEFVIGFRDLGDEHAAASAERIRSAVEGRSFGPEAARLRVTVTIGVAALGGMGLAEAIAAADRAMYEGKRAGRNRVVTARGS